MSEKFGSLKFSCLTRSKVAAAKAWERGWITNGKWLVSSVIWIMFVSRFDCLLDGGMNPFGRFSVQSMSAGKQDMMVRYE